MRKRQPDDVLTTFVLPGELHRSLKAECALAGISVSAKLIDLLEREYPDAIEPAKRKRRQPSKLAQLVGAE